MDGKNIVKIGSYVLGGLGILGGAVMSILGSRETEPEPNNDNEVLEPDRID